MKAFFRASALCLRLSLALPAAGLLLLTACGDGREHATVVDRTKADDTTIVHYLADKKITNAQKQPSGLYYVPVSTNAGGVPATAGKTVSVRYTGTLLDGTVFDASSQHGDEPFSFVLGEGQVIRGWDDGIALMHKGEKSQLLIPSGLAYGADGAGSSIPPDAVLRFDVELLDVK